MLLIFPIFHLGDICTYKWVLVLSSDVDIKDPDEKSIMTFVAQFVQFSNDIPTPGDHLQVSIISSYISILTQLNIIVICSWKTTYV